MSKLVSHKAGREAGRHSLVVALAAWSQRSGYRALSGWGCKGLCCKPCLRLKTSEDGDLPLLCCTKGYSRRALLFPALQDTVSFSAVDGGKASHFHNTSKIQKLPLLQPAEHHRSMTTLQGLIQRLIGSFTGC